MSAPAPARFLQLELPEYVHTPQDHAALLHGPAVAGEGPGARGRVALARKGPEIVADQGRKLGWKYRFNQWVVPMPDLAEAVTQLAGVEDVYLSVQSFYAWRRVKNVAALGALQVDLDYHRIEALQYTRPEWVIESVRLTLEDAGQPQPSLIVYSGRGLHFYWIHGPTPRAALPRWNACQRVLYDTLRPYGADRGALDAARVLRLVGGRHREAGGKVRAMTPVRELWDFDSLADEVLPLTRAEIHTLQDQREGRRASESREKGRERPATTFTAGTLWEARLSDIQTLRELRHWHPLPDMRDRMMFSSGVAMSYLVPPQVLQRELYALAREVGGWTEGHTKAKMQTVFERSRRAAAGEKDYYAGAEVDPRYRMTNDYLMGLIEVETDEEPYLRTLIGEGERKRRHQQSDEDRRRAAGMQPRGEYLAAANAGRTDAFRLSAEGYSVRAIATELGLSKSKVQRLLKGS